MARILSVYQRFRTKYVKGMSTVRVKPHRGGSRWIRFSDFVGVQVSVTVFTETSQCHVYTLLCVTYEQ